MFTIKVPDEEWEDKHKLALEREMLGLVRVGAIRSTESRIC